MEERKEIKRAQLQNPWRIFFWEAFLFSLTLGLGIISAIKINEFLEIQRIEVSPVSLWRFLLYFFFIILFLLFLIRFVKFRKGKGAIFKALFVLAVFLGGVPLLSFWLPDLVALTLMIALIFWWLKKPSVLIQDICLILGIAGVGSLLGLRFKPEIVVFLLIIFSVYDFLAVYKTKHMVKMAKEMIASRAILALIVPPNVFSFQESLEKIRPGGKFLILGGGDILFPLILAASLIRYSILDSLIVAVFSLIGLFVSFWIFVSQRVRQPIPALPPIALFSIIAFLITLLI